MHKLIDSKQCNAFTIPSTLDYLPARTREERRENYENEAEKKQYQNGRMDVLVCALIARSDFTGNELSTAPLRPT